MGPETNKEMGRMAPILNHRTKGRKKGDVFAAS